MGRQSGHRLRRVASAGGMVAAAAAAAAAGRPAHARACPARLTPRSRPPPCRRAAGEMLLDELFEAFGGEVVAPLAAAVAARLQARPARCAGGWGAPAVSGSRGCPCRCLALACLLPRHTKPTRQYVALLQEAEAARAAGREDWWRLREACLYGVGTVSDRLLELGAAGGGRLPLDVPGLMAGVLQVGAGAPRLGWGALGGPARRRAVGPAAALQACSRAASSHAALDATASPDATPLVSGGPGAIGMQASSHSSAAVRPHASHSVHTPSVRPPSFRRTWCPPRRPSSSAARCGWPRGEPSGLGRAHAPASGPLLLLLLLPLLPLLLPLLPLPPLLRFCRHPPGPQCRLLHPAPPCLRLQASARHPRAAPRSLHAGGGGGAGARQPRARADWRVPRAGAGATSPAGLCGANRAVLSSATCLTRALR